MVSDGVIEIDFRIYAVPAHLEISADRKTGLGWVAEPDETFEICDDTLFGHHPVVIWPADFYAIAEHWKRVTGRDLKATSVTKKLLAIQEAGDDG